MKTQSVTFLNYNSQKAFFWFETAIIMLPKSKSNHILQQQKTLFFDGLCQNNKINFNFHAFPTKKIPRSTLRIFSELLGENKPLNNLDVLFL